MVPTKQDVKETAKKPDIPERAPEPAQAPPPPPPTVLLPSSVFSSFSSPPPPPPAAPSTPSAKEKVVETVDSSALEVTIHPILFLSFRNDSTGGKNTNGQKDSTRAALKNASLALLPADAAPMPLRPNFLPVPVPVVVSASKSAKSETVTVHTPPSIEKTIAKEPKESTQDDAQKADTSDATEAADVNNEEPPTAPVAAQMQQRQDDDQAVSAPSVVAQVVEQEQESKPDNADAATDIPLAIPDLPPADTSAPGSTGPVPAASPPAEPQAEKQPVPSPLSAPSDVPIAATSTTSTTSALAATPATAPAASMASLVDTPMSIELLLNSPKPPSDLPPSKLFRHSPTSMSRATSPRPSPPSSSRSSSSTAAKTRSKSNRAPSRMEQSASRYAAPVTLQLFLSQYANTAAPTSLNSHSTKSHLTSRHVETAALIARNSALVAASGTSAAAKSSTRASIGAAASPIEFLPSAVLQAQTPLQQALDNAYTSTPATPFPHAMQSMAHPDRTVPLPAPPVPVTASLFGVQEVRPYRPVAPTLYPSAQYASPAFSPSSLVHTGALMKLLHDKTKGILKDNDDTKTQGNLANNDAKTSNKDIETHSAVAELQQQKLSAAVKVNETVSTVLPISKESGPSESVKENASEKIDNNVATMENSPARTKQVNSPATERQKTSTSPTRFSLAHNQALTEKLVSSGAADPTTSAVVVAPVEPVEVAKDETVPSAKEPETVPAESSIQNETVGKQQTPDKSELEGTASHTYVLSEEYLQKLTPEELIAQYVEYRAATAAKQESVEAIKRQLTALYHEKTYEVDEACIGAALSCSDMEEAKKFADKLFQRRKQERYHRVLNSLVNSETLDMSDRIMKLQENSLSYLQQDWDIARHVRDSAQQELETEGRTIRSTAKVLSDPNSPGAIVLQNEIRQIEKESDLCRGYLTEGFASDQHIRAMIESYDSCYQRFAQRLDGTLLAYSKEYQSRVAEYEELHSECEKQAETKKTLAASVDRLFTAMFTLKQQIREFKKAEGITALKLDLEVQDTEDMIQAMTYDEESVLEDAILQVEIEEKRKANQRGLAILKQIRESESKVLLDEQMRLHQELHQLLSIPVMTAGSNTPIFPALQKHQDSTGKDGVTRHTLPSEVQEEILEAQIALIRRQTEVVLEITDAQTKYMPRPYSPSRSLSVAVAASSVPMASPIVSRGYLLSPQSKRSAATTMAGVAPSTPQQLSQPQFRQRVASLSPGPNAVDRTPPARSSRAYAALPHAYPFPYGAIQTNIAQSPSSWQVPVPVPMPVPAPAQQPQEQQQRMLEDPYSTMHSVLPSSPFKPVLPHSLPTEMTDKLLQAIHTSANVPTAAGGFDSIQESVPSGSNLSWNVSSPFIAKQSTSTNTGANTFTPDNQPLSPLNAVMKKEATHSLHRSLQQTAYSDSLHARLKQLYHHLHSEAARRPGLAPPSIAPATAPETDPASLSASSLSAEAGAIHSPVHAASHSIDPSTQPAVDAEELVRRRLMRRLKGSAKENNSVLQGGSANKTDAGTGGKASTSKKSKSKGDKGAASPESPFLLENPYLANRKDQDQPSTSESGNTRLGTLDIIRLGIEKVMKSGGHSSHKLSSASPQAHTSSSSSLASPFAQERNHLAGLDAYRRRLYPLPASPTFYSPASSASAPLSPEARALLDSGTRQPYGQTLGSVFGSTFGESELSHRTTTPSFGSLSPQPRLGLTQQSPTLSGQVNRRMRFD